MALNIHDLKNEELFRSIQGNILKGHGRKHTVHLFVKFNIEKRDDIKSWIVSFATNEITSAYKQFKEAESFRNDGISGGIFISLFLTAKGYELLSIQCPPQMVASDKPGLLTPVKLKKHHSFMCGMRNTIADLKDPPYTDWESGYQNDIHAMLMFAHNDEEEMQSKVKKIELETQNFFTIVNVEYGHTIRNADGENVEPFGYVDGISQPSFLQDGANESVNELKWNQKVGTEIVLVPDMPDQPNAYGSYFVFRKLEQNVKAFKTAELELAKKVGYPLNEHNIGGAMLIGRFEDGTPLTLQKTAGMKDKLKINNFNYDDDREAKLRCPFNAHIRKVNPRHNNDQTYMIARRAIPYGISNVGDGYDTSKQILSENSVGLLFMCYQASIERQFETIQATWANNPNFPSQGNGTDAIVGRGLSNEIEAFSIKRDYWGNYKYESFKNYIKLKGGEYFFAPSITFLRSLLGYS